MIQVINIHAVLRKSWGTNRRFMTHDTYTSDTSIEITNSTLPPWLSERNKFVNINYTGKVTVLNSVCSCFNRTSEKSQVNESVFAFLAKQNNYILHTWEKTGKYSI